MSNEFTGEDAFKTLLERYEDNIREAQYQAIVTKEATLKKFAEYEAKIEVLRKQIQLQQI